MPEMMSVELFSGRETMSSCPMPGLWQPLPVLRPKGRLIEDPPMSKGGEDEPREEPGLFKSSSPPRTLPNDSTLGYVWLEPSGFDNRSFDSCAAVESSRVVGLFTSSRLFLPLSFMGLESPLLVPRREAEVCFAGGVGGAMSVALAFVASFLSRW